MAYYFYMGEMLLPIAPKKLQLKVKNQNKTYTLINQGEVNVLKKPGLTEIEFEALLPNVIYPFSLYDKGDFQQADYYLGKLEDLKTEKKKFQFIVSRKLPNGDVLFNTNIKCSLEDYSIVEDAKEYGMDVMVKIKLKQSTDFKVKTCKVKKKEKSKKKKVKTKKKRSTNKNTSKAKTYTVKKGDCLWKIAKKFYGDGSKYTVIYKANKKKIKNENLIYAGQKLTIPALK